MDKDRRQMAERILKMTLEIIYLLTGEDYIVVKKISEEDEGWSRNQDPITVSPPHSLIHERNCYQEILDLTNKMAELLTGEVPIRCQDVTVYFSMVEWEYLQGHKDQYEDITDNHQTVLYSDESIKEEPSERSPPYAKWYFIPEEDHNVPQDEQVIKKKGIKVKPEDVTAEETCADVSQMCKEEEESPTDTSIDDRTKDDVRNLLLSPNSGIKSRNTLEDSHGEHLSRSSPTTTPSGLHGRDLCTDPTNPEDSSSGQSQIVEKEIGNKDGNVYPCSECGKNFSRKSILFLHKRIHRDERPYSCSECGKNFRWKSDLTVHERIHSGEKPYVCPECGKQLTRKSYLIEHLRTHSKEKPYSCSECGKCLKSKSLLNKHQRTHTGEKPYVCKECGKRFSQKSDVVIHWRTHTGEKPYVCSECGKCFTRKLFLMEHLKTHTGEKPFSCSVCGKCFSQKSNFNNHLLIHTGEKPFSCPECGKCYNHRSTLYQHKKRCHFNIQTVANGLPQMPGLSRPAHGDVFIFPNSLIEPVNAGAESGIDFLPLWRPPPRSPSIALRMDKSHMTKTILHLTVDIIYLLTGEDYCVIKQRSGERLFPSSNAYMLLRWNRSQSPDQDKNYEQEILDLTNKIIHLLTGEGEDLIDIKVEVTEEEELFGCSGEKYKEKEDEDGPVCIKTDGSLRCPSPPHTQDPSEQDEKGEILIDPKGPVFQNVGKTDKNQIGQLYKEEEIPTDAKTDGQNGGHDPSEESPKSLSEPGVERNNLKGSSSKIVSPPNLELLAPDCAQPFPGTTDTPEHRYFPLRDEYSITVTLQQDSPEEEKPFSCSECGKGFTKKSSLVRHRIIHMGEKPFSCTVCSKSFARKSTLVEHKKTHTCEKPYSCSDCGKCFVRKANLLDHQRIHTGEKSFVCPVCAKCFTNKTILVRHQKSHSGEKPFSCQECGKCFGHKSVLVKHQIVHTGEKPFPCSECGKCFTQKGNLLEHQKIHTGERPFFCSYCGKYFTNKAVLMRHQVTHSKQRPFTCAECGKCFMHKANLIKHEKSHMAESPR
ncbi:uncharacterized protein RB166_019180 [Leptodactylus fuscus]|uniref:uncharacterized protein LOC142219181 n=1 Tax=Leptodactylus fuscus TaxID=238119 RepID=UPI003F4EBF4B